MKSLLSIAYMCAARASCLLLFTQAVRLAFSFAFARAGSSRPARMAMMAITTRSSIGVNAPPTHQRVERIRPKTDVEVFTAFRVGELSRKMDGVATAFSVGFSYS